MWPCSVLLDVGGVVVLPPCSFFFLFFRPCRTKCGDIASLAASAMCINGPARTRTLRAQTWSSWQV